MAQLPTRHRAYPLIALLAGAVMVLRVVATTGVFNNTVDEPYHIGSAMVLWETKHLIVGAQHPPLARWVIAAPLVMQGLRFPQARGEFVVTEFAGFGIGQEILFGGKLPYWRILTAARHSLLIFSVLALFYIYRLGKYLANPLVGMLATVFFSVDPTFLAHSGLVGTDVAGCAGFVAGWYYLVRLSAKPQAARGIVAGVALGLALACKFSCALLVPIWIVFVLVRRIRRKRSLPLVRHVALMAIVAFVVLWATYGFAVNPMREQAMFTDEPAWARLPSIVREQPIPMPSFFLGQIFLVSRAASGVPTYLNGRVSYDGWMMYFPEALAVKEPVGFLIALIIAVAACGRAMGSRLREVALPSRVRGATHGSAGASPSRALCAGVLVIPIVIYFALSMSSRYQLGIRHLLPILPLMYLSAATQFVRIRRVIPLIALILLATIETAFVHPDYLAFFNFACGGPSHGDRYLIDSNLDWGQDLNRLAMWLKSDEANRREYSIRCAYATEPLVSELGLNAKALSGKSRGLFAISKNVEHRLEMATGDEHHMGLGEDYSWVSRYPLVKRIGYSIDVYDLDSKDVTPK